MASNASQSPTQMAAIFSCEMCPEVYTTPADLDRHRQIHEVPRASFPRRSNGRRYNAEPDGVERARSEPADIGRSHIERAVANRGNAGRTYHFCPRCNCRMATRISLQRHIDAYHTIRSTVPGGCRRCQRNGLRCDGASPCGWCVMDTIGESCVPPSPQVLPSPDPTLSSGSVSSFFSAVRHEQRTQIQRAQVLRSNNRPVQTGHSLVPSNVATTPPAPRQVRAPKVYLSWIDFKVSPVRRYETHGQSAGGASNTSAASNSISPGSIFPASLGELADSDSALLRRRLPQATADTEPSGSRSPADPPVEPLESLRLLFQAGGIPREYEAAEDLVTYLPGIELLKHLSSNFLYTWQLWQPVFHVETWNFNECSIALLGAMACIGSVVSGDSNVIQQGQYISLRCVSAVSGMAALLPEQGQNVEYIAALCIHEFYLLGSGDQTVHLRANMVRDYLIRGLRSLDLLGPNADNQGGTSSQSSESSESVNIEWRAWVDYEQKLRVAWMVFEYDCTLALFTAQPCAIELGHLPKRFPSNQALYDAPDAHSWAKLRSESPSSLQGPLVADAMAMAWTSTQLPHDMSCWSKRLGVLIFERIIREIMEPEERDITIASARHLNINLPSAAADTQMSLLSSGCFFAKSIERSAPTAPLSATDSFNLCSVKMTHYYNHFLLSPRLMYLLMHIPRIAASPSLANSREIIRDSQRLLVGDLATIPFFSRQTLWQAAQLLRTAQDYPVVAPADYVRILYAYITVLAFAKYGPPSPRDEPGTEPFPVEKFSCSADIEEWLQSGGPVTIGSSARIYPGCSTEQIMQDARRQLCRTDGWCISNRFFDILVHFNNLDVPRD